MGKQVTLQERANALYRRVEAVKQVAQNLHSVDDLPDNGLVSLAAEGDRLIEAINMASNLRWQLHEHRLSHVSTSEIEDYITIGVITLEERLVKMMTYEVDKAIKVHTNDRIGLRAQRQVRGDAPSMTRMVAEQHHVDGQKIMENVGVAPDKRQRRQIMVNK